MTQAEFIARYQDEIGGILYDALVESRGGAVASLWLRRRNSQVRAMLAQMYAELTKAPVASNGVPQPARK